jgi:hypothetical protein
MGIFLLYSPYFDDARELFFNKMESRISEDTRSELFRMFFKDLNDHLAIGKGMNSTYYFPLWNEEIDGVVYGAVQYRNLIENGYLQLLLTGGLVHIILFLLVLVPAAIKGIFMSSNQFVKACGILVLLRLIDMLFYGLPTLSLWYILVWISVGVCYKTSIRNMTNDEIRCEFNKINLI